MENRLTDEIKKIVASERYDLEYISFEFDIPFEQLEKYKNELIEKRKMLSEVTEKKGKANTLVNQHKPLQGQAKPTDKKKKQLENEEKIRFLNAIEERIRETDDVNELKSIKEKLTPEICENNPIIAIGVKRKIEEKIAKINNKNAIERLYNNISPDILLIVSELAKGTVEDKKALEIISNEAKKRTQGIKKTVFTLSEEQQRKQIAMQIKGCLRRRAKEFPIDNPKATIEQLQTLGNISQGEAIECTVQNMIERNKFEDAKNLCDTYCMTNDKDNPLHPYISSLRTMIKNAENKQKNSVGPIK